MKMNIKQKTITVNTSLIKKKENLENNVVYDIKKRKGNQFLITDSLILTLTDEIKSFDGLFHQSNI